MVPVLSASPVTMSKIIEGRFRFPQKARLKFNHEILKQLSRIQITAAPSFILIKESLSSSITALVFITPTPAGSVSVTKARLWCATQATICCAFMLGFARSRPCESELKPLGKSTRRPPGVLCRALLFDVPTGIHSTVPTQIRIPILAFRLHALDGANPEIAIALRSWKLQRTRSGLFHQSSRSTRYQLS